MTMKTFTLTFTGDTATIDGAVDGLVYQNGYQDTVLDESGSEIPNPVSKAEFGKDLIRQYIRQNVEAYNVHQAKQAAETAAKQATEAALGEVETELIVE